jgi:exosortase
VFNSDQALEPLKKKGTSLHARHVLLFSFCALTFVFYRAPLSDLLSLGWNDDRYTHLPLIPLISFGLIYFRRRKIFADASNCSWSGIPIMFIGAALAFAGQAQYFAGDLGLSLAIAGVISLWIGCFVCCYGPRALREAIFPLSMLLLFIPLPAPIIEAVQVALQQASGEVTYRLFHLVGVPVFRQGLVFSLPGLDIEVARECSGIRSTIALLITSLVLGHLFLRSAWRMTTLVLLTIPIAIFKNAVRITTLSWLGVYVSKDYLLGQVHNFSGLPVSALGLCLIMFILLLLQRPERRASHASAAQQNSPSVQPNSNYTD